MSQSKTSLQFDFDPRALSEDFPSRLAHEIRSPTGVVRGVVDQLGTSDDPMTAKLVGMAHRSTARLEYLGRRLDLMGQLASGNVEFAPRPVELKRTLGELVNEARDVRSRRKVEVEVDVDAEARVTVDPTLFHVAVREMMDNALRHARERVAIVVTNPGEAWCIAVKDDGPGVAPEAREVWMKPLVSVPARSGLGLGLAFADAIARLHGGHLDLLPTDTGAHFTLSLPHGR